MQTIIRRVPGCGLVAYHVMNDAPTLPEGHSVVASELATVRSRWFRLNVIANDKGETFCMVEEARDLSGNPAGVQSYFYAHWDQSRIPPSVVKKTIALRQAFHNPTKQSTLF